MGNSYYRKNNKRETFKGQQHSKEQNKCFFGQESEQKYKAINGAVAEGLLGSGTVRRQRQLEFSSHGVTGSKGAM